MTDKLITDFVKMMQRSAEAGQLLGFAADCKRLLQLIDPTEGADVVYRVYDTQTQTYWKPNGWNSTAKSHGVWSNKGHAKSSWLACQPYSSNKVAFDDQTRFVIHECKVVFNKVVK